MNTITNIEQFKAASAEDQAMWLTLELDLEELMIHSCCFENQTPTKENLTKWLSSPDGCDAIEQTMINKGYTYTFWCVYSLSKIIYGYTFHDEKLNDFSSYSMVKYRAIHYAAAEALLAKEAYLYEIDEKNIGDDVMKNKPVITPEYVASLLRGSSFFMPTANMFTPKEGDKVEIWNPEFFKAAYYICDAYLELAEENKRLKAMIDFIDAIYKRY